MRIKLSYILACSLLFCIHPSPLNTQSIDRLIQYPPESEQLAIMFDRAREGIVYCYSNNSKTTGIFISKDGWILTAGHKVDKDFPTAHPIHVKLTRREDAEVFKSTEIILPSPDWDLVLFKIDCKPKFYFKNFKTPHFLEENWVFGFRATSGKVPSGIGYVTINLAYQKLLLTTATSTAGSSGSPVINRRGQVLGIVVKGYAFGDTFFISSVFIKEYIKTSLKK